VAGVLVMAGVPGADAMIVPACRSVSDVVIDVVVSIDSGLAESAFGMTVCVFHGDLLTAINYTPRGYIPGSQEPFVTDLREEGFASR
jgi:hypothetical protein